MIKNNFNLIVKFEDLKSLAKKTGIAIKTLENLYNEKSESINFNTLNTLCKELKLKSAQELVSYKPDVNLENKFAPENEGIVWVNTMNQHTIDRTRPGHWEMSPPEWENPRDIWVYLDIEGVNYER